MLHQMNAYNLQKARNGAQQLIFDPPSSSSLINLAMGSWLHSLLIPHSSYHRQGAAGPD